MKRTAVIVCSLLVVLFAVFLFFMSCSVVVQEGYPTWEAVRNKLIYDGSIVVTFPLGVKVTSAECDDPESEVVIDGRIVKTKIGHSSTTIRIVTATDGKADTIAFRTQKFNAWNRIRFEPEDRHNPNSDFIKFENGVRMIHHDVIR